MWSGRSEDNGCGDRMRRAAEGSGVASGSRDRRDDTDDQFSRRDGVVVKTHSMLQDAIRETRKDGERREYGRTLGPSLPRLRLRWMLRRFGCLQACDQSALVLHAAEPSITSNSIHVTYNHIGHDCTIVNEEQRLSQFSGISGRLRAMGSRRSSSTN